MNERLAFYADELRDAVYDLDEFDDCDEIRDIKQAVHRVAQDLRAMAFDPRYDVEHCGEHGCPVPPRRPRDGKD